MTSPPEPRIGDAERDTATRALGEHYAAGRLTKEEYDERADVALRARTESELRPLFVDLPSAPGPSPAPRPSPTRGTRPSAWPILPLVPVLAVLAVLVVVFSEAWWLLFVLGWVVCCGPGRHLRRRRQ